MSNRSANGVSSGTSPSSFSALTPRGQSAVLAARRTQKSTCFFQPTVDESVVLQGWLLENLDPRAWKALLLELGMKCSAAMEALVDADTDQVSAPATRVQVMPYSSEKDAHVWQLVPPELMPSGSSAGRSSGEVAGRTQFSADRIDGALSAPSTSTRSSSSSNEISSGSNGSGLSRIASVPRLTYGDSQVTGSGERDILAETGEQKGIHSAWRHTFGGKHVHDGTSPDTLRKTTVSMARPIRSQRLGSLPAVGRGSPAMRRRVTSFDRAIRRNCGQDTKGEACWLHLRRTWAHRAAIRQSHSTSFQLTDSSASARAGACGLPCCSGENRRFQMHFGTQFVRMPDRYGDVAPAGLEVRIGRATFGGFKTTSQLQSPPGNRRDRSCKYGLDTELNAGAGCSLQRAGTTLPQHRRIASIRFALSAGSDGPVDDSDEDVHMECHSPILDSSSIPREVATEATHIVAAGTRGSSWCGDTSPPHSETESSLAYPKASTARRANTAERWPHTHVPFASKGNSSRWSVSASTPIASRSDFLSGVLKRSASEACADEVRKVAAAAQTVTVSPLFLVDCLTDVQLKLLEEGLPLMEEVLGLNGLVLVSLTTDQ